MAAKKIIANLLTLLIFIGVFGFVFTKSAYASILYLSPGSRSVGVGGSFSLQVRINTKGEAVNAVSAFLSYPADKVEVSYVSYSSSAFGIGAQDQHGGGTIKISRGNISGLNGDYNVATIGFTAKSQGSATVYFIGGSKAPRATDSSDSLNLSGSPGSVISIGQASSSSNSGSSSDNSLTNNAPSSSPVPPQISDITVSNVATNSATINWKTSTQTDSYIQYGLDDSKYFLFNSNQTLTTDHSAQLDLSYFKPGTALHYQIKSTDVSSQISQSSDQVLVLKGYQIKVKLTDSNGQPLSNVTVSLYSNPQTTQTDSQGFAIFNNVSPDKHLLIVQTPTQNFDKDITVSPNNNFSSPQNFNVPVNVSPKASPSPLQNLSKYALALPILILVILIVLITLFIKRNKQTPPPASPPPPPTTIPQPTSPLS